MSMLGEEGKAGLANFWKHALEEQWARDHPVVSRHRHELENLIPFTYHLDEGELQRNQGYYYYSCGSPVVQYSQTHSLDAKFCLAAVAHVLMRAPGVKKRVMNELVRFTAFCHNILEGRTMPSEGFYGETFGPSTYRGKQAGERIMGDFMGIFGGTKSDGRARVPYAIHMPTLNSPSLSLSLSLTALSPSSFCIACIQLSAVSTSQLHSRSLLPSLLSLSTRFLSSTTFLVCLFLICRCFLDVPFF